MVNAEYGKAKLSLTLHFNEYNKFRLLLDGKEPMDFENTGKAINYIFETEVGRASGLNSFITSNGSCFTIIL